MTAIARAAAGVSKITYNGITFGDIDDTPKAAFHLFPPTYRIAARNVYADDNRTIQHVSYTLTVVSGMFDLDTSGNVIGDDLVARDGIEFVKKKLSQAGKRLDIVGLGFGDKEIVDGAKESRNKDVMWGVKPKTVDYQPIGGTRFWQINWVCEFNISECAQSNLARDWLSFTYDVGYSNDFEGYSTRVITGKVVVAGLKNGVVTQTNVDRVRDQIAIAIPLDYKRTTNDWPIPREKNIIEFSIVDEQLDMDAPPVGLTEYDFDVEVSNDGIGFGNFALNMSATGKTERGQNRALVANWFFVHVLSEVAKFRNALKKEKGQGIIIPLGVTIGHRKGSRETRCSAQFSMVTCLRDLMARGSIWEPLLGTNYQRWATSMGKLWGNRGNANVRVNGNDDIILDICEEPGSPGAGGPSFNSRIIGRDLVDPIRDSSAGEMPSLCANVDAENSWVDYDTRVMSIQRENSKLHMIAQFVQRARRGLALLGAEAVTPIGQLGNTNVKLANEAIVSGLLPDQTSRFDDILEISGNANQFIILEGKALRIKFKPAIPELFQVGGNELIEVDRIVQEWSVADFLGCPLFAARWWIVYRITGNRTSGSLQTLPKNPLVCSTPDPGGNLDLKLRDDKPKRIQTPEQQARTNKLFTEGAISGDPFAGT